MPGRSSRSRVGRLSTRGLARELSIGGAELDELVEELVEVQQVAHREGGVLVWKALTHHDRAPPARPATPDHLAGTVGQDPVAEHCEARKVVFCPLGRSSARDERCDGRQLRIRRPRRAAARSS